jgi:hypothetical protein
MALAKLSLYSERFAEKSTLKPETIEVTLIRDYLLGRMAQGDLPRLEERILIDGDFYEELTIAEDELIDEYVRGDLGVSDRQSFESHFMSSPKGHEKLRFALALRKHVATIEVAQSREELRADKVLSKTIEADEPPPKKRTFLTFLPFQNPMVSHALAAVVLLFIVGASWMVWRTGLSPRSGPVFAIELAPSVMTRDIGETPTFVVPTDRRPVRLQLDLAEDEYPSYEVVLLNANGRTLSTKKNLKSQSVGGRPALFVETETSLAPDDYWVKLSGVTAGGNSESAASYRFRIVSR